MWCLPQDCRSATPNCRSGWPSWLSGQDYFLGHVCPIVKTFPQVWGGSLCFRWEETLDMQPKQVQNECGTVATSRKCGQDKPRTKCPESPSQDHEGMMIWRWVEDYERLQTTVSINLKVIKSCFWYADDTNMKDHRQQWKNSISLNTWCLIKYRVLKEAS